MISVCLRSRRILTISITPQQEAVDETAVPNGHLTLTASLTFDRSALAPGVGAFLSQHPGVTMPVLLLDRIANLVEEGSRERLEAFEISLSRRH
nr:Transcriptional regulator, LysR family protein [Methylocystis sp. SC2]